MCKALGATHNIGCLAISTVVLHNRVSGDPDVLRFQAYLQSFIPSHCVCGSNSLTALGLSLSQCQRKILTGHHFLESSRRVDENIKHLQSKEKSHWALPQINLRLLSLSYHSCLSVPSPDLPPAQRFSYCAHSWREKEPTIFNKRPWPVPDHVFNIVIEAPCPYHEEKKKRTFFSTSHNIRQTRMGRIHQQVLGWLFFLFVCLFVYLFTYLLVWGSYPAILRDYS